MLILAAVSINSNNVLLVCHVLLSVNTTKHKKRALARFFVAEFYLVLIYFRIRQSDRFKKRLSILNAQPFLVLDFIDLEHQSSDPVSFGNIHLARI